MADGSPVALKKFDEELRIVWGEVYAPNVPDSQGDFMSAAEIRKMAYRFMEAQYGHNIDLEHDFQQTGSFVVESFIAREGDPLFIEGAWVLGVRIPSDELWQAVKDGKINGFSFAGEAITTATTLALEVPDQIVGVTDTVSGHSHTFVVAYDQGGSFLGGKTGPALDGHVHEIKRGTITEPANGHTHRFSFVEELAHADA